MTNEITEKSKRPTAITIICVLGFIGALLSIPVIIASFLFSFGYALFLGALTIGGFVCMVGLWKMKKWAAYGYTAMVTVNQIILLVMGTWTFLGLLIPGIVIFIALSNVSNMD